MEYKKGWRSSNSTPLNGAIYNLDDYLPSGYVDDFMKMGYSHEDAKNLADLATNSVASYDSRKTIGICKCVKNWKHFKEGDVYIFEYKPDETNCWLYYLTRNENGVLELCNWSFFDNMFKIVE